MDLLRTASLDVALVEAPAVQPISLADAKAQVRASDFSDDDDLLQSLVDAAVSMLDGHAGILGRALISQQWVVYFDYAFPSWRVPLPLSPLISVDDVQFIDNNGVLQTVDPSVYVVIDGPVAALEPAFNKAWPSPRSQIRTVKITFTAGYGTDPADVPAPIRAAMKLLVGHLYYHREAVVGVENRDSSAPLPLGVDALIAPFRARTQF
jgi:uncharacterized phiE125 gp8 family phage protein